MSTQSKRLSSARSVRHARLRSWLIMGLVLALLVTLAAGAQGPQPATAAPLSPASLSEQDTGAKLQDSQNVELVGQIGGVVNAVAVSGNVAYVGVGPRLVILNIADPAHPRLLARLEMPPGTHSHKVRVDNGLMLINRERNHADKNASPENFRGGLGIYDVTKPASPREITRSLAPMHPI